MFLPPCVPICAPRTLQEQFPSHQAAFGFSDGTVPFNYFFSQNKAFSIAESVKINKSTGQTTVWLMHPPGKQHDGFPWKEPGLVPDLMPGLGLPFPAHLPVLADPFFPGPLPLWLREVQPWIVQQLARQNPSELSEIKQAVYVRQGTWTEHEMALSLPGN